MKKLILGATGAIGSALAKKIAADGGQVHLVARDESSLSDLASELNASFTTCDVLEDNFSEKILSDLGDAPIDGLAYCVGSIDLKPLKLSKKNDFLNCFNLNLISATEIIRASFNKLKENKGSIVLFSTVAARKGFTNHSIISSAKAAVEGLTVALAAEFSPSVRVNCIAPSLSKSKMGEFLLKNEKIAEGIAKLHPLKRLGKGSDFSGIAKFLMSEESSWMTGQIIGVDGGRSSIA
jgi:NAD(P)-dependent dehydrogenase (short-subunit alcohol dehydrogenase family)|tara:strand:- start:86 stop:796 length:711 start_codon:yes stop_codon:yes gene_type:complete